MSSPQYPAYDDEWSLIIDPTHLSDVSVRYPAVVATPFHTPVNLPVTGKIF
jgi:hypothetical protein